MFSEDKTSIAVLVNRSLDLYEKGDYESAENLCIKILKTDSSDQTAWINLGNIRFLRRDFKGAAKAYKKADSLSKNNVLAKVNLANVFLEQGDFYAAYKKAKQALLSDSCNLMAGSILGSACLSLGKYSEAVEVFLMLVKLDSADAWNYNYLSQAYEKNGDYSKACDAAWQALKLDPANDSHHLNFAYLLYDMALEKRLEEAQKYAENWLRNFPENPIASHIGNALCGKEKIERANEGYLVDTFDVFAPDFEGVLKKLEYKVPAYVKEYLIEFYGRKNMEKLQILDAGCGTGLCGKEIKKILPQSLIYGIDLSEKMLDEARKKNIYAVLEKADLSDCLSAFASGFDLIVSGDVFTYFGRLDSLFEKLCFSLKKNGRIVFSVSENTITEDDFFLHLSGRFLHSENYIKNVLKNCGFRLEKMEKKHLRFEGENDVFGFMVSAIKI